MKIEVEVTEQVTANLQFTTIKKLSFAPEADLKGDSISIDQFTADIITDKAVGISRWCWLYDDRNVLFAKYWVMSADHIDPDVLRLTAKSPLILIDQTTMPEIMYTGKSFATIVNDIFASTGWSPGDLANRVYRIDQSFASATITGFCPEQTARERLLWVCFALGAYVRTCFSQYVDILPIPVSETFIPMNKTFMRPSVTFSDWVTSLKIVYYTFRQAASEEEYSSDNNSFRFPEPWMAEESFIEITNDYAPYGVPENPVVIEGIYLLNADNVSAVISRLVTWYFNRTEVDLDVINNGEYKPGDKITVCVDEESIYGGYLERCDFSFGVQARSKLHVSAADSVETGLLLITYTCDDEEIGRAQFTLPAYYTYFIQNPYLDLVVQDHRIIYRPHNAAATGETYVGENHVTEPCSPALDLCDGVLEIISVDAVDVDENGVAEID